MILFAGSGFAAEMKAPSVINTVTVFPSGAEVTRVAKVRLSQGEHTVVFDDLPASAVEESIRVEGTASAKVEIGSVDARRWHVPRADAQEFQAERQRIEDELDRLRDEKSQLEAQVQGAETQKVLLSNLAQLPGKKGGTGVSPTTQDWPMLLALIASGSQDAQRAIVEATKSLRQINRQIEELQKKLDSLSPALEERTEAKVFVSVSADTEVDFAVRYQVGTASWRPLYDLRLATGGKTTPSRLDIVRRAAINQQTGESWKDVAVSLSTTRPHAGASAPELRTVRVDFRRPRRPKPMARNQRPGAGGLMSIAPEEADAMVAAEAAPAAPPKKLRSTRRRVRSKQAAVVAAPFHALYAVPGRLTIPDTGETKRVQLLVETVEPELIARATPKTKATAYLHAKLVVPKGSPLLPGPASLFRDGTYVGAGRLPLLSPGEDHEVGFGADDLVRVRYSVAEEKRGESGLITTSRKDTRNYRVTVRNLHEREITVSVYDQVPVSLNEQIEVEFLGKAQPTKTDVENRRGVMVWERKLGPDDEFALDFGYRVTWPSDKSIVYR